jgi:hydroxymethylpyrimidine pyrophosphatase-like HAD family hydrolase
MRPVYEQLRDRYQTLWFRDLYSGERWFEILPRNATKANAILKLKEMLGCDRIVCFGDAENDLSMFRIADESCAMANAVDEVKSVATRVIGSNEEDGVARYLLAHDPKNGGIDE